MSVESQDDVVGLMRIGKIVAEALRKMADSVEPNMTTADLDEIGAKYLRERGARSAPQITYNYPTMTIVSVNEVAAHGIPGPRRLNEGDIIKIDISAELGGYFADAALTVPVGKISEKTQKLVDCALRSRDEGIAAARAGEPLNAIGRAAERVARRCGFSVIRDLTGHGVGRAIHEKPSVYHFYMPQMKQPLSEGLVITVEPHITMGSGRIVTEKDGWTLRTRDRSLAAAFEHTIVVTNGDPIIVTAI